MTRPIIVATDGSPRALPAVEYAAQESARRDDQPIHVVTTIGGTRAGWWRHAPRPGPPDQEAGAREMVGHAAASVFGRGRNQVEIETGMIPGDPAGALRDLADEAEMVIVGGRGGGARTGLSPGSVIPRLTGRLPCPLIVVGRPGAFDREIVVGVDGHPGSEQILDFAFAEAALRRVRLRALHAWTHPISRRPGDMVPLVYDVPRTGRREARLLTEAIAGWRARYPEVEVVEDVVRGRPAKALTKASATAGLVVVGSRPHWTPWAPAIPGTAGSVARAALRGARCPVAVVRRRRRGETRTRP